MSERYLLLVYDEVVKETKLAYLLKFGDEEKWVPKSLLKDPMATLLDNGDEILIETWFCIQEGLEEYEVW